MQLGTFKRFDPKPIGRLVLVRISSVVNQYNSRQVCDSQLFLKRLGAVALCILATVLTVKAGIKLDACLVFNPIENNTGIALNSSGVGNDDAVVVAQIL